MASFQHVLAILEMFFTAHVLAYTEYDGCEMKVKIAGLKMDTAYLLAPMQLKYNSAYDV